jgi:hypothetical protein
MRMLLEGVKQAGNTIGLQELTVGAGCRNGTLERRTEQRVVIDDEDFVVHLLAPARFLKHPDFCVRVIVIWVSSNCDTT